MKHDRVLRSGSGRGFGAPQVLRRHSAFSFFWTLVRGACKAGAGSLTWSRWFSYWRWTCSCSFLFDWRILLNYFRLCTRVSLWEFSMSALASSPSFLRCVLPSPNTTSYWRLAHSKAHSGSCGGSFRLRLSHFFRIRLGNRRGDQIRPTGMRALRAIRFLRGLSPF